MSTEQNMQDESPSVNVQQLHGVVNNVRLSFIGAIEEIKTAIVNVDSSDPEATLNVVVSGCKWLASLVATVEEGIMGLDKALDEVMKEQEKADKPKIHLATAEDL